MELYRIIIKYQHALLLVNKVLSTICLNLRTIICDPQQQLSDEHLLIGDLGKEKRHDYIYAARWVFLNVSLEVQLLNRALDRNIFGTV